MSVSHLWHVYGPYHSQVVLIIQSSFCFSHASASALGDLTLAPITSRVESTAALAGSPLPPPRRGDALADSTPPPLAPPRPLEASITWSLHESNPSGTAT
eukprot:CAMPEP_0174721460 /NCGR_PEP_ID=MMETSP1094-20130205/36253_1 /TAXON_ID=156173 /ORGANISM="Chrysochromulina brevifilum, Strain UTEX LB 985" /LENGTH=99 /DNA_ID=CAMNT_0015922159 /DNA_START=190 /DNA_END=485 /DNA_ORIENTATION=+